ncbi:MAG: UDP-glucose/GDP-mannose dehydrogenase family protein [Candidatus Thermoplasmatota archaeon]
MKISIIGTGYVGLVTGTCLAKLGNQITFLDIDKNKIETIRKNKSPIYEKGLEELLKKHKKNITATTKYDKALKETDITFICVGTPTKKNGNIEDKYLKKTTIKIGQTLKKKNTWHLIIVKSTVPPGTTQNIIIPILEQYSEKKTGKDYGVAVNPEFLREGAAIKDFLQPDRIIYGYTDKKTRDTMRKIYKKFKCPIIETTTLSTAEMIKYASNAFLATKISFINEIGNICKKTGIDTYEVAEGMGLDKRIGRAFLDSGIGWGGSCFPKDLDALITYARKIGEEPKILESVKEVNQQQPLKTITILKKHIPDLKNKTIGILGLAYKPDTDDIRETRTLPIIKQLLKEGAKIKTHDPKAMNNFKKTYPNLNIEYCKKPTDILKTDAVIITTKWEEYKKLDYTKTKIIIDGRKIKEAKKAKKYEGVCW